jgi:hypothetical protein
MESHKELWSCPCRVVPHCVVLDRGIEREGERRGWKNTHVHMELM